MKGMIKKHSKGKIVFLSTLKKTERKNGSVKNEDRLGD